MLLAAIDNILKDEEEHLAFKLYQSMTKGYPIGDNSRYQYCMMKLNVDAVVVNMRVMSDVLVLSSLEVTASLVDQIGILG